jgi:MOSC domain-containing protein YiiM
MRVETVAVGTPRRVATATGEIETAIWKTPVAGPVMVRKHNLDGDRQADLKVHGGEFKAVYVYAAEDYEWWRTELGRALEAAQFGENLTVRGLDPAQVSVGDVLRFGEAELAAAQPRLPCAKLAVRFGDPRMIDRFTQAQRWGIYFRVAREGPVAAGDPIEWVARHPEGVPVYDLARVRLFDRHDLVTLRRLAALDVLPPAVRERVLHMLGDAQSDE